MNDNLFSNEMGKRHIMFNSCLVKLFGEQLNTPLIVKHKTLKEVMIIPITALLIDLIEIINTRQIYFDKKGTFIDLFQHEITLIIETFRPYDTTEDSYYLRSFTTRLERIYDILTLTKSNIFLYIDPVEFLQSDVYTLNDHIKNYCLTYGINYDSLKKEIKDYE